MTPISSASDKVFAFQGMTFTGKNSEFCIIEGQWSDGEDFRYQAWDSCEKMSMERISPKPAVEVVEQVYGPDRKFIIPAGSESFRLSNDSSAVRIFRNSAGVIEEILISD